MTTRKADIKELAADCARLWNLEYPDYLTTANAVQHDMSRYPKDTFLETYAIEDNGEVLGVISAFDCDGITPIKMLSVEVTFDPSREADLIEPTLAIVDDTIARAKPAKSSIYVRNNMPIRTKALTDRGYVTSQTIPVSVLNVTDFDPAPYEPVIERIRSEGIRLTTIDQLQSEGIDWVPLLRESTVEMLQDVPNQHITTPITLEQYRVMMTNAEIYDFKLLFVAVEGGRIVGYSRVSRLPAMPNRATTGLSGVVRTHRRRGIVTALKVMSIKAMKELGIVAVQTDNDETNPMLQLNYRLGYRTEWEWWKLSRTERT